MSLRIRRGTDSQRQGITPLEGELLYATDTKKLYVGDGSTGGGIIVDSSAGTSTINDLANVTAPSPNTNDILKWSGSAWITAAQNAASALNDLTNVTAPSPNVNDGILWNGTAWVTGPSVATLNDITNVSVPTAPGVGQSLVWSGSAWIAGTPYGVGNDINANIIGGDSTVMVNVINQTIIATTLTGNFVGDVFAEDGVSKIVSNGAVAGQALFTGDLEGNVNGSVFTTNSTRIIDGDTGNITGNTFGLHTGNAVGDLTGNVTGNTAGVHTGNVNGDLTGEHIGSVFADDSTLLVDGVNGTITGLVAGKVSTGESLDVTLDQTLDGNDGLVLNMHRGTDAVKLEPNNLDRTFVSWKAWNGSEMEMSALIGAYHKTGGGSLLALSPARADGTVFTTAIEMDGVLGTIAINTTDKVTSNAPIESTKYLRVGSYATGALPGTAAGTIAFDSTTNTFKGYNGSAWVALDTQ